MENHKTVSNFYFPSECYYIDVRNAYNNYEVQGIYYIFDYDVECDGRNIYK